MKPKNYSAALMLCISLLFGVHSSQARSVFSLPTLPEQPITDFNSLYTGYSASGINVQASKIKVSKVCVVTTGVVTAASYWLQVNITRLTCRFYTPRLSNGSSARFQKQ